MLFSSFNLHSFILCNTCVSLFFLFRAQVLKCFKMLLLRRWKSFQVDVFTTFGSCTAISFLAALLADTEESRIFGKRAWLLLVSSPLKLYLKDSASEYLVSDKRQQGVAELPCRLHWARECLGSWSVCLYGEPSFVPGQEYETRLQYLWAFNVFLTVTKWAGGQERGAGKKLLCLMCGFSKCLYCFIKSWKIN